MLGGNIAAYQVNNFSREFPGGSDTGISRRSNPNPDPNPDPKPDPKPDPNPDHDFSPNPNPEPDADY